MKNVVVIFVCLIVSCSAPKTLSSNTANQNNKVLETERDGSSLDKAVVIMESTESQGVNAEYAWLKNNFPGYKSQGQSLIFNKKKPFDIIKIITAEGE